MSSTSIVDEAIIELMRNRLTVLKVSMGFMTKLRRFLKLLLRSRGLLDTRLLSNWKIILPIGQVIHTLSLLETQTKRGVESWRLSYSELGRSSLHVLVLTWLRFSTRRLEMLFDHRFWSGKLNRLLSLISDRAFVLSITGHQIMLAAGVISSIVSRIPTLVVGYDLTLVNIIRKHNPISLNLWVKILVGFRDIRLRLRVRVKFNI